MTSCRAAAAALIMISAGAGVITAAPASAQITTDERVWTNLSLQERPGTESPWRWSGEFVLRTRQGLDEIDVFVMRGLVGYDLTERSSVSVGFALIPSFPAVGGTLLEKRLFEQYLWSGHSLGGSLALRTRFEQRWVEANSSLVWRLRQQIRYTRPLAPQSRYSLIGWEEILLHANESTRYVRGLEQNRAFGGLSRTLSDRVRIEIGYLNQFSRSVSGPNRLNHILLAVMAVAF